MSATRGLHPADKDQIQKINNKENNEKKAHHSPHLQLPYTMLFYHISKGRREDFALLMLIIYMLVPIIFADSSIE